MSPSEMREEERLRLRANELKTLTYGWLWGEGAALNAEGMDWAVDTLLKHTPWSKLRAHLYPTVCGNLQVEWSHGALEITLVFDLLKRSIEADVLRVADPHYALSVNIHDATCATILPGFFESALALEAVKP